MKTPNSEIAIGAIARHGRSAHGPIQKLKIPARAGSPLCTSTARRASLPTAAAAVLIAGAVFGFGATGAAAAEKPASPAPAPAAPAGAAGAAPNTVIFAPAADEPAAPAQGKQPAAKNEIVELPRYVVTGERVLPLPESWRYTTMPGYEILSNAYDRTTKRFLKDFQFLQQSIRIIWPTLISQKPSVPTLIVLCARGDSFSVFVPEKRDPDIFITPTSIFVEDKERGAIVIDYGATEMLTTSGFFVTSDPYQQFYRQYSRFLMRRANNNKPIPPWLEEGLARIFTTIDFTKKSIEFGKLAEGGVSADGSIDAGGFSDGASSDFFDNVMPNEVLSMTSMQGGTPIQGVAADEMQSQEDSENVLSEAEARMIAMLSKFGHISSLKEIFNPSPDKPLANWSRQCFAFVHMCLYGHGKKYQKAFLEFAKRAMAGEVDETDFKECFERSYKQMEVILRGYVEEPQYVSIIAKAKPGQTLFDAIQPVEMREATQAEIGRIKGEVLRLAGHNDESRQALIVPYYRRERDAGLLASLGLLESLEGNTDRARRFLEAAAKDNVTRPRAYAALARLRLDEALASPAAPGGRLSTAQTASVLEPLFTARGQPPPMEEVYALIGETWMKSVAKPQPANLEVMMEGAALFPRNIEIIHRAAALHVQHGDPESAALLVKLGIKMSAANPAYKKDFDALQRQLSRQQRQRRGRRGA